MFDAETIDLGRFPSRALLTGAGFSRDWGGHLANEIAQELTKVPALNEDTALRQALDRTVDFEEVLADVRRAVARGDLPQGSLVTLEQAIGEVFQCQEQVLQRNAGDQRTRDVAEFISWFGRGPRTRGDLWSKYNSGYVFTLNLDLLLERMARNNDLPVDVPVSPGVEVSNFSDFALRGAGFAKGQYTRTFVSPELPPESLARGLNYIKLHGSFNWSGRAGEHALVVAGRDKKEQIDRHPRLVACLSIFRRVLMTPGMVLLVVGYSFRDAHVNEIIENAVAHGLRLFVVDPAAEHLRERSGIRDGVVGIWPGTLRDLLGGSEATRHCRVDLHRLLEMPALR